MHICERNSGDVQQLKKIIRHETNAKQRDRCRVVALALAGYETQAIQQMTARSRGFVQRWVYAYRDHGLDGLSAKKPTGRKPKLTAEQQTQLKLRMIGQPTEADGGVCTLRGKDAQRILRDEFGVKHSLSGVYQILHRLGLSCLKPRPRHRKNNKQVMQQWLDEAPLFSRKFSGETQNDVLKSGSKTKPESANKGR